MPDFLSKDPKQSLVQPKPWPTTQNKSEMAKLAQVRGICLDIDDTVSTLGKLTSEAYSALWSLYDSGFVVVPVTGRPAGWCDHIARFWPVHAVIGENGAFTFFKDSRGVLQRSVTPSGFEDQILKEKLVSLRDRIRVRFPKSRWASDQAYREYDLAVDICEDVDPWSSSEVLELVEFCRNEGAQAKISSIHVNIWFGNYDKRKGFEYWFSQGAPGWTPPVPKMILSQDEWIYVGDSPNDEPMFARFTNSVGVANLRKYLKTIQSTPTWMTSGESGLGFSEVARVLVSSRS
jgi:HAD superfamily hydrolase (TIGR01484 family)